MRAKSVETLAWVLIYSGLLLAVAGWFVQREASPWGAVIWVTGLVDAAAGAVLVWWRSRMNNEENQQ